MKTTLAIPQLHFLGLRDIKHSLFLFVIIFVSFLPNSKRSIYSTTSDKHLYSCLSVSALVILYETQILFKQYLFSFH